ncbi:UNVERIFIED_CONTAM: hypothetical protein PYX00_001749 [Menopon gallinae]|uniref:aralkylamine N-acetyltransferase n=1 Tax=Menopon gallinae TaxID=328185 RepID=A0AAW2IEN1_9NEOP
MKKLKSLRIVPALEVGEDVIFGFLLDNFFVDEPMNSYLKRRPAMEEFKPLAYVKDGYSFVAFAEDGNGKEQVAGVVINKIESKEKQYRPPPKEGKGMLIFNVLDTLDKKFDVWSRVQINELFYTIILSVSRDYRGLNIGSELVQTSLKKAAACGLTHAVVECSSFYSARIIEKFGYEKICEMRYEDYKNENGEVIFKIDKPHEAVVKYLKTL